MAVFTLPGKKKSQTVDAKLEVVVINVTETPIERPKKTKRDSLVGKRKPTHLSHMELMRTEKLIENWYEVQRNLYLQVAREFVLKHIIQKLEV